MAEEIIFKTSVDTGTTAKDLQAIDKELNNIDKTTKSTSNDLNKTFDDLNKRVESGAMSMRESTQAIKQYQTIALQAGRESPIGKEALQRAGDLKDKLGDLKTEINNLGTDGANMKAALQLGSTITAGYGALTGVQALLGKESENLTKTLVKLQAVQAILAALEEVRNALEKESFLMQKAKVIQTNILSAATAAYTTVVGASTGAMKAARIAMLAIPIVALVAGVTALVATFAMLSKEVKVNLTGAMKAVTASMSEYLVKLNLINEAQNKVTDRALKNLDQEAKRRIAMGEDSLKVQREINLEKIKELEIALKQDEMAVKALKTQKERLVETQKETSEKIKQAIIDEEKAQKDMIWTVDIERSRNRIIALKQQEKVVDQELQKSIYNTSKEITKRKDEVQSEKDAIEDLKTSNIELGNEIRNQNKKTADAKKAEEDKAKEDAKKSEQELIDAGYAFSQKAKERRDQEQANIQQGYIDQANAHKGLIDKQIENSEHLQKTEAQIDAEILANKEKVRALNYQATTDSLTTLSNLAQLFAGKDKESQKRAFNIQKAVSVAQATIDTYKGATAALASGSAINPVYGFASAAAVVTAGLLNVKKILSQKFEGGGDTSSTSVQPPSTTVNEPQPQLANADTTLTSSIGNGKGNYGKVYVVDSEITAKQNATANTLSIATVG